MDQTENPIRAFILDNLPAHPADIVAFVSENFNISRQRAHRYVTREVKKGEVVSVGKSRWTRYFLVGGNHIEFSTKIIPGLAEDQIWSKYIKPMVAGLPENIQYMTNYGFTEIFNNAIDHSEGTSIYVELKKEEGQLDIVIMDNGVGIFRKIQAALKLESPREAILHLSKGKFTTDPTKHTGEGIFFTSRICDRFSILSDEMYFTFKHRDWFLSPEKKESFGRGTSVRLQISLDSKKTPKEVMDEYSDQEIGFGKTIVAVALSADPNDPHVSRSQAKRLLMGLEKFREVVLDFKGVSSVGQAFVDEVFRVFQNEHPEIKIHYIDANEEVESMIKRGRAS